MVSVANSSPFLLCGSPYYLGQSYKVNDFNLGLGKDDHVNLTMHKVKTTDTDRFLSLNHSNQFLLTDDGL